MNIDFIPGTSAHVTKVHVANFCAAIKRAKTRRALEDLLPRHLPWIPDNLRDQCRKVYSERLAEIQKH